MDTNAVYKQPPYSMEAEQSVLGAILREPTCIATVAENLRVEDFYLQQNKLIYSAMLSLWNRGDPIDPVTISKELGGEIAVIGGFEYLAQIAVVVPTIENLKAYIKVVEDKSVFRKLIDAANKISGMSYEETDDVTTVLDIAEKHIYDIIQNRGLKGFSSVSSVLVKSFEHLEKLSQNRGKIVGVPTGYSDLDKVTGGFQPSDLIIIAARPAMGKTSFALNIAQGAAIRNNVPVAIFSLEMSEEQLGNRLIWSEAKLNGEKFRSGNIADEEWRTIAMVVGRISSAPIYIDDTPGNTVTEIKAKCKRLQLERGLGLVVIDYLQLMQSGKKTESRQNEVAEISRSLKVMAKELNIPVIALSQLSRATAQRSDHRPQLSDLRESGSIEQDADMVMFLHRPDYYDPDTEEKNIAECIIAKHRNGPVCKIKLYWNGDTTTFVSLDRGHEEL